MVLWCCSQKCALSCSQHDLIRFVPLKKCSFFHSFFNTHTLTHTRVRAQNQVRVRAIVLRGGGSCHGRGAAADLHRGLAPEPRGAADALPGRAFGAWQNQPLSERATLKGRVCLMDSSPLGALLSFSRTSRKRCSLSLGHLGHAALFLRCFATSSCRRPTRAWRCSCWSTASSAKRSRRSTERYRFFFVPSVH